MINSIFSNLLWTEGISVLVVIGILFFLGLIWWRFFLYLGLLLLLFALFFFRYPVRACKLAEQDKNILVCPADGRVIDIASSDAPEFDGYHQRVSIFLSIFDVHVNWIPMAGTISKIMYKPGEFCLAYLPKSSEKNERNTIRIISDDGTKKIEVRQIAGAIARRISCWVSEGEAVKASQPYGMIKFGSRADILLPANVTIKVKKGEQVFGGQTILGMWK